MLAPLSPLVAALVLLLLPLPASAWQLRFQGGTVEVNKARAVVVDGDGNPIVGGYDSSSAPAHQVVYLAKLSKTDGSQLWRASLGLGSVEAIARKSDGTLVVAGYTYAAPGANQDALVAKVSEANGQVLWSKTFGGTDNASDRAVAIALDASGNAIVGGTLRSGGRTVFLVLKLAAASGNEDWRKEIHQDLPSNECTTVGVDADGDVFAAGWIERPFGQLAALGKFAADTGAELWLQQFGFGDFVRAYDLVVDAGGNAIVVGEDFEVPGGDPRHGMIARKFATDGDELWDFNPLYHEFGGLDAVTLDSHGDVVVAGKTEALREIDDFQVFRDDQFAVLKLASATGAVQWRYVRPGRGLAGGRDVLVDAADDVVAVGDFEVFKKGVVEHGAIVKVSGTSGVPVWLRSIANTELRGVAIDADGIVTAAGGDHFDPDFSKSLGIVTRLVPSAFGKQIALADNALKPAKRKIQIAVKDTDFLAPGVGSAGDPAIAGATLVVENPTTHEQVTFDLPTSNWKSGKAFKYADKKPFEGPCTAAAVKNGQWSVKCAGAGIGFTLDEASQGSIAATLTMGSERSCVLFGGEIKKDLPAVGKKAGVFQGKNAPPPAACP